jgi:CheY-like chemotaxis protein
MPFELPEMLSHYLLPLLIAVPLAIVVIIVSRRSSGSDEEPPLVRPPVREPAAPAAAAVTPTRMQRAGPAAVLLVDDSAVARARLGKLFAGAGYQVTLAQDGVEAMEKLGQGSFDVLITDLEMPNKDGFELIAAVQGNLETEDLPIIAITGHDELHARVNEIQGIYGLFKKPWNDRELLKRVEALVMLHQATAAKA